MQKKKSITKEKEYEVDIDGAIDVEVTEPQLPSPQPGDLIGSFVSQVTAEMSRQLTSKIDRSLGKVDERIEKLEKLSKKEPIQVVLPDGTVNKVEGLKHNQLEDLLKIAHLRLPILLVGMAGVGKTQACEQVAEGLGLPFFSMSVGAQTSKSDIIGYMNATGTYVSTLFREAFEKGGVFLMDEIDAGNANVLIQINSALSNGYCAFPDKMVKAHPDFVFVASANTFGNGANRQYVGRNQLDSATLDRFVMFDFKIDDQLEYNIIAHSEHASPWIDVVRAARKYVADNDLKVLITPRASMRGIKMLDTGFSPRQVLDTVILSLFPVDKRDNILSICKQTGGFSF